MDILPAGTKFYRFEEEHEGSHDTLKGTDWDETQATVCRHGYCSLEDDDAVSDAFVDKGNNPWEDNKLKVAGVDLVRNT